MSDNTQHHLYKHTFANGFEISIDFFLEDTMVYTIRTPFEVPEECQDEYELWRKEYVNPDILSKLPEPHATFLAEQGFVDEL